MELQRGVSGAAERSKQVSESKITEPMMTSQEFDSMFDPDNKSGVLLRMRFDKGVAVYTSCFEVHIVGKLWPGEVDAMNQIIKIYKEQNRQTTTQGRKASD